MNRLIAIAFFALFAASLTLSFARGDETPQEVIAAIARSRKAVAENRVREAAETLERLTMTSPHPALFIELGNIHFATKDYESAEKGYRTALKIAPENELAKENLAKTLFASGKFDDAIRLLSELCKNSLCAAELDEILLSAFIKGGKKNEAVAHLSKRLAEGKGKIEDRKLLISMLMEAERNEEALSECEKALKSAPSEKALLHTRLFLLGNLNRESELKMELERLYLVGLSESDEEKALLGYLLYEGDVKAALALLQKVAPLADETQLLTLAELSLRRLDYDSALRSLALLPKNSKVAEKASKLRAKIYATTEKYKEERKELLKKALAKKNYTVAEILLSGGNVDELLVMACRTLANDKTNKSPEPEFYIIKGRCALLVGDTENALRLLKRAYAFLPHRQDLYNALIRLEGKR
ncbi:MAG: hypothetical protein Kow0090_15840 [Myxococcota bacterium]